MAASPALESLSERLDGQVLVDGDPGYDEARTVWNAMVDRRPTAIVRCASVADVVAGIRIARELDLEIGIRCGGHSIVGHAVPDGGLMLDLTPYGAVRVDPVGKRAWVQGGALLGALDDAAQVHGLATTAGNVSHTGVGGLTLGGGMGWLARQYGLSCDNAVSFEMVTAAGDVVRASADENPDLFWGLKGGGGNFGVVTEFELVLHAVGTQALLVELAFPVDTPAALAAGVEVVAGWRDLSAASPRAATFTAGVTTGASGRSIAAVGYVWVGDVDEGLALLSALRALGPAAGVTFTERVEPMSYLALQRIDDTERGHERRRYWKGHYLQALPDEAIARLLSRGAEVGGGGGGGAAPARLLPNLSLQAYGGAIADVPDDATAFSHRATLFELVVAAGWTEPDEDAARMAAARRCAAALEPYASGVYVNVLDDESEQGLRRAYSPDKLARLVALKDRYDPDNVFHLNHNIRPSVNGG